MATRTVSSQAHVVIPTDKKGEIMLLKTGELARRTGLTVRTLHHYDAIGLLSPSSRSDAGYRLYNRADIARLHQIQALQRLNLSLAEIGSMLASGGTALSAVIAQQIAALDQQVRQTTALRNRLVRLSAQLADNHEPDLAEWLNTLELMTMYDKYMTPEELNALRLPKQNSTSEAEWADMLDKVRTLITRNVPPEDEQAQSLAQRWLQATQQIVGGKAVLMSKLNIAHWNDPEVQSQSGIDRTVMEYIGRAAEHHRLQIYAKYLPAEVVAKLRDNRRTMDDWLPLITGLQQQMEQNARPDSEAVQALARRWNALNSFIFGDDPVIKQQLRAAYIKEPALLLGTGISLELLDFLRRANEVPVV